MVSGFVTSPCDQLRIFSGEARLMRIASKSAIGFARSNGLERNKISSTSCGLIAAASGSEKSDQWLMASDQYLGPTSLEQKVSAVSSKLVERQWPVTND
jgi:hypothetical protein